MNDEAVTRAAALIADGGIVAYPTDTFYGLGVDPRRADGVAAIYLVKGRAAGEALPLIAGSLEDLERTLGALDARARRLATRFWPGPLTLVIPLAAGVLDRGVSAGGASVAVRVPDHPLARALASRAGGLITSTSANRSGEPPATTADAVARALDPSRVFILDGGTTPGGPASTIVDVCGDVPRLVRPGQVAFERVLESLQ